MIKAALTFISFVALMLLLMKFLNEKQGVTAPTVAIAATNQTEPPPATEPLPATDSATSASSSSQPRTELPAAGPQTEAANDEAPVAEVVAEEPAAEPGSGPEAAQVSPAPNRRPLLALEPRSQPAACLGTRKGNRPVKPNRKDKRHGGQKATLVFGEWKQGGWTDLLSEPRSDAPRLSQALIGDQVRVVEQTETDRVWSRVELMSQDIEGWVINDHLTTGTAELREFWATSEQYQVIRAPGVEVEGGLFLPFGATLYGHRQAKELRLFLPDSRQVLLDPEEVQPKADPLSIDQTLQLLREFHQVRFGKGGNTAYSMDAGGLLFLAFHVAGVEKMPRDIEAIRQFGTAVTFPQARAGDVVFYSNYNRDLPRPVILLDDAKRTFIEASARGVSIGRVAQMRNRTVLEVRRYGR